MPFPTVEGKTFQEDLETIKDILGPIVIAQLDESSGEPVQLWNALERMFKRIDVVATALYYKVWGDKTDPSQAPL